MSKANENDTKEPEKKQFSCPCGDPEEISKMMKNIFGDNDKTFDCFSMMKKVCNEETKFSS